MSGRFCLSTLLECRSSCCSIILFFFIYMILGTLLVSCQGLFYFPTWILVSCFYKVKFVVGTAIGAWALPPRYRSGNGISARQHQESGKLEQYTRTNRESRPLRSEAIWAVIPWSRSRLTNCQPHRHVESRDEEAGGYRGRRVPDHRYANQRWGSVKKKLG